MVNDHDAQQSELALTKKSPFSALLIVLYSNPIRGN
jgi:hypothetical protein